MDSARVGKMVVLSSLDLVGVCDEKGVVKDAGQEKQVLDRVCNVGGCFSFQILASL